MGGGREQQAPPGRHGYSPPSSTQTPRGSIDVGFLNQTEIAAPGVASLGRFLD